MSRFVMKSINKTETETKESDNNMILLPVGGLKDIVNGRWKEGMRGEMILIGGLAPTNGYIGKGNTGKTTNMREDTLTAAGRVGEAGIEPRIETHDTEDTHDKDRMQILAEKQPAFEGINMFVQGIWKVTDYASMPSEIWFDLRTKWLKEDKMKKYRKDFEIDTPIKGLDGRPIKMLVPTFTELDSLSDFKTSDIIEMMRKNEIGNSAANTLHARLGLHKLRVLMEICPLATAASDYVTLAAQVGVKMEMASGPMAPKMSKDMQYMKVNEKVKGVPDKFNFLPTIVYQVFNTSQMWDNNKCSEYPKVSSDHEYESTDLNLTYMKVIRNKTGTSGSQISVVVSQRDGVLKDVTEFHFCRTYADPSLKKGETFGMNRVGHGWQSKMLPGVNFTRNTLRETLAANPKLQRAINITAEIGQMKLLMRDLIEYPDMDDFVNKIEEEYGWDNLLDTRGYWTLNQYEHPDAYLSSYDLLRMYHGLYVPYWWKGKPAVKAIAKAPQEKLAA